MSHSFIDGGYLPGSYSPLPCSIPWWYSKKARVSAYLAAVRGRRQPPRGPDGAPATAINRHFGSRDEPSGYSRPGDGTRGGNPRRGAPHSRISQGEQDMGAPTTHFANLNPHLRFLNPTSQTRHTHNLHWLGETRKVTRKLTNLIRCKHRILARTSKGFDQRKVENVDSPHG